MAAAAGAGRRQGAGQVPRGPSRGGLAAVSARLRVLCSGGSWQWAVPLVQLSLGLPMLRSAPSVIASNARQLAAGGAPVRQLVRCRRFQFGLKYWLASSAALCFILGLAARPREGELLRRYPMLYAFIATAVSMTDRVESTLSRAALRAGGTLAGGLLGLAVMVDQRPGGLGSSPVGIMAVLCAVTFLTGCVSSHRLTYGAALTLLTMESIVLCQFGTACCVTHALTAEMFATRVVSVLLGCTLPALFSQLVLPWYTSDWARETMAGALVSTARLVRQLYDCFFQEHRRAHVASRGAAATAELLRLHGLEARAAELEAEAGQQEEGEEERQQQQEEEVGEVRMGRPSADRSSAGGGTGSSGSLGSDASSHRSRSTSGGGEEDGRMDPAPPGAEADVDGPTGPEGNGGAGGPDPADRSPADVVAATAPEPAKAGGEDPTLANAVKSQVSGPLVAVQTSLMKDVTVWTRGIYATPMIVPALLRCCLLAADRLAALQLVVAGTPPPVYGRLSGWAFEAMVLPVHRETEVMLDALIRVADLTSQLLLAPATSSTAASCGGVSRSSGPACLTGWAACLTAPIAALGSRRGTSCCCGRGWGAQAAASAKGGSGGAAGGDSQAAGMEAGQAGGGAPGPSAATAALGGGAGAGVGGVGGGELMESELREAVRELDLRRLQLRQHVHDIRRTLHASVRSVDAQDLPYARHPDDSVHVNSMLYALVKVLDKVTSAARTVLEHKR